MICKNDFVKRQETDCKACKRALCMCAEVAGPGCARTGHIIKREATQGAIHFKEDVLRVKRSRFRIVIPSLRSRASSERSEESLSGERSFAPLRMTKPDGLLFAMYWGLSECRGKSLTLSCPVGDGSIYLAPPLSRFRSLRAHLDRECTH